MKFSSKHVRFHRNLLCSAFAITFGALPMPQAHATCPALPNALANSTTADATHVMANFNTVRDCANTLAPLASPTFTGNVSIGSVSTQSTLAIGGLTSSNRVLFSSNGTSPENGGILFNVTGGTYAALANFESDSTDSANIRFKNSTGSAGYWIMGTGGSASTVTNGGFFFYDANAAAARVVISTSGNVGIGTNSPTYPLYVNGTAYATGAAGALSDIRHKTNVVTLSNGALETVMRLRPVSYLWKTPTDNGMKGEQIGFIAQEVEKILPSVVLTQDDKLKTKGLKYTEIIPLLAKAMQEMKSASDRDSDEISLLKSQNEVLHQENSLLTSRLDRVENLLLAKSETTDSNEIQASLSK